MSDDPVLTSEGRDIVSFTSTLQYFKLTRMWADAQRDGRSAEYRWRPLFNAAKFG